MTRRTLLAAPLLAAPFAASAARLPIKKAVEYSMLPNSIPALDRFQLAKDCGFEEIECNTTPEQDKAEELLAASRKTGVRIHSVMNSEHWRSPLSSSDPAVVEKSMEGMRTSLRNAKLWGSDTVLLVPAVVNPETSYAQAWERSQRKIKELIPLAQESKVIIGIEEVWNKFLLSPLEFARYIDDFNSPWIRAYFDVGNVAITGYPHDWIRTLGKRINRVHLKDFSKKKTQFVKLTEGDVNWKEVRKAFAEVGFTNYCTVEFNGDDYLEPDELVRRIDKIFADE